MPPERILDIAGAADIRETVNRAVVVGRNGAVQATAENAAERSAYGLRQRVLGRSGDAAAQAKAALTARQMTGRATVWGNLNYSCGCCVTLHRPEWGLDGTFPVTAVRHIWKAGLFTTEIQWQGTAG